MGLPTALAVLPTVCWLWVLIASPRTTLPGSSLDALVRERLRAHQQRLATVAFSMSLCSLLAMVLALPSGINADAAELRQIHGGIRSATMPDTRDTRGCFATWLVAPVCWRLQPDGSWAVEGQLDDGTWAKGAPLEDGTWRVAGLAVAPGAYPAPFEAGGEEP